MSAVVHFCLYSILLYFILTIYFASIVVFPKHNQKPKLKMKNEENDLYERVHPKKEKNKNQAELVRLKAEMEDLMNTLEAKQLKLEENNYLRQINNQQAEELQKLKQNFEQEKTEHMKTKQQKVNLEDLQQFDTSWKLSYKEVALTDEKLGHGAYAGVMVGIFRAQRVAVKRLHELIMCKNTVAIINREIHTMSKLRHPNLLLFIGAVLDHPSGDPLIITEIMDISLRKAYENKQIPMEITKISVLRDAASGLNYLHCHHEKIIHRDVSSANVLLESKGSNKWRAKLSDFGSANISHQAFTQAPGAAVYSAPESVTTILDKGKKERQTTKMDVFSYGILLCEVMACQFPETPSRFDTFLKAVSKSSPPIGQLIKLCVDRIPDKRPSMEKVIEQLDQELVRLNSR